MESFPLIVHLRAHILVSTPEAVHNISRSVHLASHQHHPPHQHHQQPSHSASKKQQQHTSKLRAPQVKLGKSGSAALPLPRTGDLSIFNDESPARTANPAMTSQQTPVSTVTPLTTNVSRKDQISSSSTNPSTCVVDESSKVKKPRSLKPKVLKSNTKEPPPKSPLTTSIAASSKTPQGHLRDSTKPSSSLAVHKTTVALEHGRGKVGGARTQQEDKENATPWPAVMPKAHDILAEQVSDRHSADW